MSTYAHYKAGPPERWDEGFFFSKRLGKRVMGKLFLREHLDLDGMEVSLNRMEPGFSMSFLHRHKAHEELYLFLSGSGEFQVDGEVFPIEPGSAVRVSPSGVRAFRNTGGEPLIFVVIQAASGTVAGAATEDGERVPGDVTW